MSCPKSAPLSRLAVGLLTLFAVVMLSGASAVADDVTIQKGLRCIIDVSGLGPVEFDNISGPCVLFYSEPYPDADGYITIDTEILAMDLWDGNIAVRRNPGLPSPGLVKGITPWIDFPAESFFDVMIEIELPDHMPGELLINYEPMHITSIIDQYPRPVLFA